MSIKKIFIFGAGYAGRDILRLICDINENIPTWEVLGYVENNPNLIGTEIDSYQVYKHEDLPVSKDYYGVCGIQDPKIKRKIVQVEIKTKEYTLPALIHPSTIKVNDFSVGPGSLIFPGAQIGRNVRIGECVWVSDNIVLGHDLRVGDYTTLLTSLTLNGNCNIGESCIIGSGAIFHQGVKVGNESIVGMGTVVFEDIPDKTKVVDFPRKIKTAV